MRAWIAVVASVGLTGLTACGGASPVVNTPREPLASAEVCEPAFAPVPLDDAFPGVPSELAEAQASLVRGDALGAALAAHAHYDGVSPSSPAAGVILARALYRAGLRTSALAVMDELSQPGEGAPGEPYARRVPPELFDWTLALTDAPGIGSIARNILSGMPAREGARPVPRLLVVLGQQRYESGMLDEAESLLARVPDDAPEWSAATWLRASVALHASDESRAARLFEALAARAPCEARRDLARLSLARLYFDRAAESLDEQTGLPAHLGAIYVNAYALFERVTGADHVDDAAMGRGWSALFLDEYAQALDIVVHVGAAYRATSTEPDEIEAVAAFSAQDIPRARAAAERVQQACALQRTGVEAAIAPETNEEMTAHLLGWLHGEPAPPHAETLVQLLRSADDVREMRAFLEQLDREEAILTGAPAAFSASPIGARVEQDLAVQRSFTTDQLADTARMRGQRLLDECADTAIRMDTLLLELVAYERGAVTGSSADQR